MLKILQARLQQYMNHELPDVQAGFRKGRETRDQIANIHWIIEKAREFQKNIYFCFIDYAKAFDYITTNCGYLIDGNTWPASWEICIQVKKPQLESDMEEKLFPNQERSTSSLYTVTCLLNLYTEYIMRNTGLDEEQAGFKIARRNLNNLRYADDTTLMAESQKVKRNWRASWWMWKRRVKKLA